MGDGFFGFVCGGDDFVDFDFFKEIVSFVG